MATFFSADLHLGHKNIIDFCKRPFKNVVEMESALIERFNSRLTPQDILYLLGDISFHQADMKKFFDSLNTKNVHVILGNHDPDKKNWHPSIQSYSDLKGIRIGDDYIHLCHYPMLSWNRQFHGSYHLFGHVHGSTEGVGRSMDVGVDTNDYYPYEWSEIKERLSKIPYPGQNRTR
jgi:calcineurin-like phosphoesterase family protein